MMRLACSTNSLFCNRIPLFVVCHYSHLARLINCVMPHQAITVFYCSVLVFSLTSIAFSVDEQFCRRIVRINKNRSLFTFTSFPIPVRQDMQCFCFFIPYASVQIITVFGDRCQIDDSEHRTMIRPCIGVIRARLSQIVESSPHKLSDCPFMIFGTRKINIRNVRPVAIFQII